MEDLSGDLFNVGINFAQFSLRLIHYIMTHFNEF